MSAGPLRIMSWNARALFHAEPEVRLAKARYFRELLEQYDIISVQEAHGGEAEFAVLFGAAIEQFGGVL